MYSDRVDSINQFIVMKVLERALEMQESGIDIVHMEIGEPDFDTPERIVNGCFSGINEGMTHYTHSLGILELRQALSNYKLETRNTYYNSKTQFMITGGTSPAFFNILSAILNPEDEVIITDPGYPCYANFIRFFGGKPVFLPIFEENYFDLDIEKLRELISAKTKAIILNSPSNPTGQIIPAATLDAVADIAVKNNIWVISDEIYAELSYQGKIAPSLSEKKYERCHDKLIVLDGFSKFWAMTGWRLGYIMGPEQLIEKMLPVQQNFSICAPSVSQIAALHALKCHDETSKMLTIYKQRRDYLVDRLNKMDGISCLEPQGAFYIFANIKEIGVSSMDFCLNLLEEGHLATCPGISFGPNGDNYVRFSYANDLERIKLGMNRLEAFLKEKNP